MLGLLRSRKKFVRSAPNIILRIQLHLRLLSSFFEDLICALIFSQDPYINQHINLRKHIHLKSYQAMVIQLFKKKKTNFNLIIPNIICGLFTQHVYYINYPHHHITGKYTNSKNRLIISRFLFTFFNFLFICFFFSFSFRLFFIIITLRYCYDVKRNGFFSRIRFYD